MSVSSPQPTDGDHDLDDSNMDAVTAEPLAEFPVSDSKDRIVQSVYDHILRSVCTTVASNMHELIKTGGIPLLELKEPSSRLEIFPELYRSEKNENVQASLQQTLDRYATEVPSATRKRKWRPRKPAMASSTGLLLTTKTPVPSETANNDGSDSREEPDGDDDDEDFKDPSVDQDDNRTITPPPPNGGGESNKAANTSTNDTSASHLDIWGRKPPKEPKQNCECQLCGRNVSTMRFASHLDKCMGLSTRPLVGNPSRSTTASGANGS